MGLSLFGSTSSCSCSECSSELLATKPLPNPDPRNFHINSLETVNNFVIVDVVYPDCKNFEGRKLLVFESLDAYVKCTANGELDPHFSENHASPIARFEPTERGLKMARKLCQTFKYSMHP